MDELSTTPAQPIVDAIVVRNGASLARAARAADDVANQSLFGDYLDRISPPTRRRQAAGLALFTHYLVDAGVLTIEVVPETARVLLAPRGPTWRGMIDSTAWQGMTWGIASGFVRWQLREGYAVGSINVRLPAIKRYVQLADAAGALSADEHLKIRGVQGYARRQAKRVDAQCAQQRLGAKKAAAVGITEGQAEALKQQPATSQGRRDTLLFCLLLDHGLPVSEVDGLTADAVDLGRGLLVFYRPKVDVTQTHRLALQEAGGWNSLEMPRRYIKRASRQSRCEAALTGQEHSSLSAVPADGRSHSEKQDGVAG